MTEAQPITAPTARPAMPKSASPPVAIFSIVLSMSLTALTSGLLYAYIPLKLASAGFAPWVAGAVLTAVPAGGLAGCLLAGKFVRRVGHARAFAALAAVFAISVLPLAAAIEPTLWIGARVIYGFSIAGLFVVAQSWLNDACDNAWRGRVIAVFYTIYVLAIGAGAFVVGRVALEGSAVPLLAMFFAALSILPVSLTRLPPPPPPEAVRVAVRAAWTISPVGLVGLLTVGGLTMLVQGFAPIYAAAEGYAQADIALMMFLMQFGMLAVQTPLGIWSDRVDRRYVLIAAVAIVVVSAGIAAAVGAVALIWLILIFAVWGGATEAIYSVANAHATDRGEPRYYVSLMSTLMIAWSVSALVLPAVATALTPIFGLKAFMFLAIAVAAAYGLFVAYRLTRREAPAEADQEQFLTVSAQAPLTAELAHQSEDARRRPAGPDFFERPRSTGDGKENPGSEDE